MAFWLSTTTSSTTTAIPHARITGVTKSSCCSLCKRLYSNGSSNNDDNNDDNDDNNNDSNRNNIMKNKQIVENLNDNNNIEVLYESDRIIAINKPEGIPHHDSCSSSSSSSPSSSSSDEAKTTNIEEFGILSYLRMIQKQLLLEKQDKSSSLSSSSSPTTTSTTTGTSSSSSSSLLSSSKSSSSSSSCISVPTVPFTYTGRLYGIHRLDRVTSGILLFAKDENMAKKLTLAFRNKKIIKYYFGLSYKKPKKSKQGWVRGHMIRGRRKSWKLLSKSKSKTNNNKNNDNDNNNNDNNQTNNYAETRFFTAGLGHLTSLNNNSIQQQQQQQPKTCIMFKPYTGKTHQLRVAAKSLGMSLIGDPIYSDGTTTTTTTNNNDGSSSAGSSLRTYLHASAIHIKDIDIDDNNNNKNITIWSPPPFDHLWEEDEDKEEEEEKNDENVRSNFQIVVSQLMNKHCDCNEIIKLVNKGVTESLSSR